MSASGNERRSTSCQSHHRRSETRATAILTANLKYIYIKLTYRLETQILKNDKTTRQEQSVHCETIIEATPAQVTKNEIKHN